MHDYFFLYAYSAVELDPAGVGAQTKRLRQNFILRIFKT